MSVQSHPTKALSAATSGAERVVQRATPADAVARARELFRAGQRVDMVRLASDMGVARATLYRWAGDRDRLLADAVWLEFESRIHHWQGVSHLRGVDRLTEVVSGIVEEIGHSESLRTFLANEGDAGFRILTAPAGVFRQRLVAAVIAVIELEASASDYRPPEDLRLLADSIVSLGERFLYHGGDPAMAPDPTTARRVIALLLREQCDHQTDPRPQPV